MNKLICFMLAVFMVLSLAGCGRQPENLMEEIQPNISHAQIPTGDEPAILDFYMDLFRTTHVEDKNTLISPLSVLHALSMTANGAKGNTLQQMEAVFGLNIDALNNAALNTGDDTEELHLANSLWFRDSSDFTINQDFLQTNADFYGADVFKAPFNADTCRQVNDWVKENTDGMIPNILDQIPDTAVMYLVNALAFDALWEKVYREWDIREGEFTTQRGYLRTVEMMHSEENRYFEDAYGCGFMKYYEGRRYAFVGLLPKMGTSLEEYLEVLDGEYLHNLLSAFDDAKVMVSMPKFQVEYDVELSNVLKEIGMTDAFNAELADFSGIGHSAMGKIFISRVLHKTFMSVDAQGTRAGAATIVEAPAAGAFEPDFYVIDLNRPFIYMLIDTETNLPLFVGAMTDPVGAEVMPIEETLSEPPELRVIWDNGSMAVKSGNYSWEGPADNGQTQGVIACGSHPLDGFRKSDFVGVWGDWLALSFPVEPDSLEIIRWPGDAAGNVDSHGQNVEPEGIYLPLEEGEWVYQIVASWNREGWKGQAEYHLYICR